MRIACALLLLLASAQASLAEVDPCAKYSDADAYNYCLARTGPAAHSRGGSRAPSAEDFSAGARPERSAPRAKKPPRALPPGMVQRPGRRGRVHFQLFVR